jgi:hypothetical protein
LCVVGKPAADESDTSSIRHASSSPAAFAAAYAKRQQRINQELEPTDRSLERNERNATNLSLEARSLNQRIVQLGVRVAHLMFGYVYVLYAAPSSSDCFVSHRTSLPQTNSSNRSAKRKKHKRKRFWVGFKTEIERRTGEAGRRAMVLGERRQHLSRSRFNNNAIQNDTNETTIDDYRPRAGRRRTSD